MLGFLTRLRDNEPVQLVMWPILGALATLLVTKGVIDADTASLAMAVAVAVLGGSGIVAARAQVTPRAHLPAVVAAGTAEAVEQVRTQVADVLGDPGVAALDQIEGMLAVAASTGRHERRAH